MNTLTNLPPEVATQMAMRLLAREQPNLIADIGSFYISMEQNRGNIIRQSRYDNLPTQPVALGPTGQNPAPMILNRLDTDATLQWYGGFVALTEQVMMINEDRVLVETVDLLSQCLQETKDQLQRENQVNNAAFINCVGGGNGDNPTELTAADIEDIIMLLRNNSARFLMDNVEGDLKFGTAPLRDAYIACGNTAMIADLRQISGFTNVANYPSMDNVRQEEWCSISNLRFFLSPLWPVSADASALGADVQNIIVKGMEAVCCVDLDGYSVQYRYTPKEIAGGPLWLYGTSGFVFAEADKVVNTNWIYNLRCTVRS